MVKGRHERNQREVMIRGDSFEFPTWSYSETERERWPYRETEREC